MPDAMVKQQGSEQTSSHYISTTKLINEINQTITNLKAVEMRVTEMQRVEAECVTSNEGQNSQQQGAPTIKIMSSPVPLDLLDLMDFGSSGGIGSGQGVHPEFFARCLLAEASRQLAGLRRRKNALEKLGRVIGEGIKKRKERSNSSKTGVRNMSLKRDLEEAGFDADSSSNQDKPTESLGGAKKAKLM